MIRLQATCDDSGGAQPTKEVILLKRIDDRTIFYGGTTNGKFVDPGSKFSYCPEEVQRAYFEAKKNGN